MAKATANKGGEMKKSNLELAIYVIIIILVLAAVVFWWGYWLTSCTSGTIADLPALCLLGGR